MKTTGGDYLTFDEEEVPQSKPRKPKRIPKSGSTVGKKKISAAKFYSRLKTQSKGPKFWKVFGLKKPKFNLIHAQAVWDYFNAALLHPCTPPLIPKETRLLYYEALYQVTVKIVPLNAKGLDTDTIITYIESVFLKLWMYYEGYTGVFERKSAGTPPAKLKDGTYPVAKPKSSLKLPKWSDAKQRERARDFQKEIPRRPGTGTFHWPSGRILRKTKKSARKPTITETQAVFEYLSNKAINETNSIHAYVTNERRIIEQEMADRDFAGIQKIAKEDNEAGRYGEIGKKVIYKELEEAGIYPLRPIWAQLMKDLTRKETPLEKLTRLMKQTLLKTGNFDKEELRDYVPFSGKLTEVPEEKLFD